MMWFDNIKNFFISRKKIVTIITSSVLALAFTGSVVGAVFGGDELAVTTEESKIKGVLRINDAKYTDNYILGDTFSFDKNASNITLLAKDPALKEIVRINNLPASEYGFMVNGEGSFFEDPSSIIINDNVKTIDVVSKAYPDLRCTLDITTIKGINGDALSNVMLIEAENTDLYQDNVLLSEQDKKTKPDANKPFLSSEVAVEGANCSGGACLRNFQKRNMKIEFTVVSSETGEVNLEVMICKRNQAGKFGDWYLFSVNGETITALDGVRVPAGSGYFEPYGMPVITVALKRGINVLTFESGSSVGKTSPANFDAIRLQSTSDTLGGKDAVIR